MLGPSRQAPCVAVLEKVRDRLEYIAKGLDASGDPLNVPAHIRELLLDIEIAQRWFKENATAK